MHLVGKEDDLGLVHVLAHRLCELCSISDTVAVKDRSLHRNNTDSVVDLVVRIALQM